MMAKRGVSKKTTEEVPEINSPEWNDYVMSHFQDNELIDGNPLTAGLRRVAEILVGEIISSKPIDVQRIETGDPIGKTTVTYEVQFLVTKGDKEYVKTYADVSDVWAGNTDDLFAVHAPATASTKAEGRALRKALKIRAVAAEELCKKDVSKFLGEQSGQHDNRITKDQVNFINMKCKKSDINVMAFVNSGEKEYKSVYEVRKDTAAKMIKRLTEISNGTVPLEESIKGYSEDWNTE